LYFSGVDLLYGENGEPVICEVNSNAFFESFEESTGINVARAYARHILDSMHCDAASEEIIE
jgi:ribosomal protein S6--L-glutamate ligase/gamma-F420-2:alpha-L-glutamate ligase